MFAMRSIGISTPCLASTPVRKITRDDVTTKCVKVQFRYWSPSQPAHTSASTAQATNSTLWMLPCTMNVSTRITISGMPVRM